MTNNDRIRQEIERRKGYNSVTHLAEELDEKIKKVSEAGTWDGIDVDEYLNEIRGGLTWQDIRRIVKIADDLLDDPKARVAFQNHNEEYYYKRVLDEYNKLH